MKQKLKSHSGAKKRFKFTATGKIKYKKAGLRHLLIGASSSKKRKLRRADILDKTNVKAIKRNLPYS